MPTLRRDRLAGGYRYYDARADDARLCLAVARTAALEHGAACANDAGLREIRKDGDGRVRAVVIEADDRRIEVRTRSVVNATGVWADEVRALDDGGAGATLRPAKGVHITLPSALVRNDLAVVLPVRQDRRSVFVVPWGESTFVGTTDTDHGGSLDEPRCTGDDVAYLLGALNAAIEGEVTPADVTGTWAGLRPLVAAAAPGSRTADLSRRHAVTRSPSGVVTVTGGKLTTYRRMAADAVDEVAAALGVRAGRSRTGKLPLVGAEGYEPERAAPDGETPAEATPHLLARYGGEHRAVGALVAARPELARPLVEGLPYLAAEAVHAARSEMARTLDDVLARRTRARLLAAEASAAAAGRVAELVGAELGWSEAERARQVEAYRADVRAEQVAAGGLEARA
jgi:glycerol-3-phosphate dehydrogenase